MKKFVLLPIGFEPPTPEIMEGWNQWFASIGERMVDTGHPFSSGKEITPGGIRDLPLDKEATTGYLIIEAADMAEAVKIAQECPMITGVRVYEAMAM